MVPTTRATEKLAESLRKADLVGQDIAAARFYKRPGKCCSWCDYLPVCTGDTQKVKETLIQTR